MRTRVKTLLRIQAAVALIGLSCLVLDSACDDQDDEEGVPVEQPESDITPVAPEPEPDLGPPRRVFAKRFVANIRTGPSPDAFRIGYLRAGATLMTKTTQPVGDEGCPAGWFELDNGGFVCNGRDVTVFDGERLPEASAAQPDRAEDLPYQYGYARRDNVPVYRALPTDDDAVEFEGYRIPGSAPPPGEGGADAGVAAAEAPHSVAAAEARNSVAAAEAPHSVAAAEAPHSAEATPAGIGGVEAEATEVVAPPGTGTPTVEEADEGTEVEDAGPPTLRSLRGDRHSILLRRMMKGFYVSLDRDFRANRRRYWRTQQHEFIPYQMLNLKSGGEFEGFDFLRGEETETGAEPEPAAGIGLPVGWVLSHRDHAYTLRDNGRVRRNPRDPGYHHSFHIVGQHEFRGESYWLGDDGNAYRVRDITSIEGRSRPDDVGEHEKWIDVDLATQTMVAYEGDTPVFATLVSTGIIIREGVSGQDHRTPVGRYRIRAKHLATTMDGDNAFDGPYSIEDVPYVMYYEAGYALHSAFWHSLFGRTKSHGCVNLSPRDARWMFGWTDPQLPTGWHGVYPATPEDGTLLIIHGETPRRRN